jgi:flap endonuclease-1
MGIRNLNNYLRDNCPNSIRCINLSDLSGKKIAIDISIYLYKYETDNALMENIYVMLSIFRNYNIIPIFIFDGKPPPEKQDLLVQRRKEREDAIIEYNNLQSQLITIDDDKKQNILDIMYNLKRQIVQMNKDKIEKVKSLIRAYGATYYDAPGESDELCALLVVKKKVWACLSEDMDLFVYGCTRVIRYFSLINHTAVLYYMKGILNELNMTHDEFKQVCILSGTDYNINTNIEQNNLFKTIKYFNNYKSKKEDYTFYEWLEKNTNYITNIALLNKINIMFDLNEEKENLRVFNDIKIVDGPIRYEEMVNIMKDENFVFVSQRF